MKERKENAHHYLTRDWGLGCRAQGVRTTLYKDKFWVQDFGLPNVDARQTLQEPK